DAASAATTLPRVRDRELPRWHPRYRRQSPQPQGVPQLPPASLRVPTPPLLALRLPERLRELPRRPPVRRRPQAQEQPVQPRAPTALPRPPVSLLPVPRSLRRLPALPH